MTFPEFHKNMNKHFGIKTDVQKYVDVLVSAITGQISMDVIKFDDWLHERHGNYEEERGISMADLIKKEYGQASYSFVTACLGKGWGKEI